MTEVNYKISTHKSKFAGYQSKKGLKGSVKIFLSTIYNDSKTHVINSSEIGDTDFDEKIFNHFVEGIIYFFIHERICLERAFNKIRIKGGMCNPCCVQNCAQKMMELLENE